MVLYISPESRADQPQRAGVGFLGWVSMAGGALGAYQVACQLASLPKREYLGTCASVRSYMAF